MFAIFIHLLYTIGRRWNLENVESIDQVYTFVLLPSGYYHIHWSPFCLIVAPFGDVTLF
jgi:hypothetical protein